MPVTLHEVASTTKPSLRNYVIQTIVDESPLVERIPFENQDQLSQSASYISSIPTPGLRHINEAGTEIKGTFAQRNNSLSILDDTIRVDPALEMQKGQIVNPKQAQIDLGSKAFGFRIAQLYVNGDPVSDTRESMGIKALLNRDPLFGGQSVNASANATEVNLAVGTANDATLQTFLYKLDQLRMKVNPLLDYNSDRNASQAFLTNGFFYMAISSYLRQLKLWDVNRDQFDRSFIRYMDIPFIDAGFTPAGAVNAEIPDGGQTGDYIIGLDSEGCDTDNGANAYTNQTPIYLIRFGKDYQMGSQLQGFMVKDHGQETTTPYYWNVQLFWPVNPSSVWQKRALARLVGYSPSGTTS